MSRAPAITAGAGTVAPSTYRRTGRDLDEPAGFLLHLVGEHTCESRRCAFGAYS